VANLIIYSQWYSKSIIKGGLWAVGHSTTKATVTHSNQNFLSGSCYIGVIVVLLILIFAMGFIPGRQGFLESIGVSLILLAIIAFGGRAGSRAKFHAVQAVLLMCITIIIIQLTVPLVIS
jgi:hypothetical protein